MALDGFYTVAQSVGEAAGASIILLFSGGRDSTCAAVRLIQSGEHPLLLTVIDTGCQTDCNTKLRVNELRERVDHSLCWISARAPDLYEAAMGLAMKTAPSCLPCLCVRLTVAVSLARRLGITKVATGFSGYQSSWVEQTPAAIDATRAFLKEYSIDLELPVASLDSKDAAIRFLTASHLRPESLEPVCHCADVGTTEHAPASLIVEDITGGFAVCRRLLNGAP